MEQAWTAYYAGSYPVGAVVVDAAGQIVARGRNRITERHADIHAVHGNPLAHAELNALITLDYQQHAVRQGYAIYTTMEPCPLCFGAIYMSGVREVHYAARDSFAGSTNLFGTTPYLSSKPMRIFGPDNEGLETISAALFVAFLLHQHTGPNVVIDALRANIPHGVLLGEHVAKTMLLPQLREREATAAEVVDRLANESIPINV
jgi:tRNA(Arg) A34 adenosine deaminase TadA